MEDGHRRRTHERSTETNDKLLHRLLLLLLMLAIEKIEFKHTTERIGSTKEGKEEEQITQIGK